MPGSEPERLGVYRGFRRAGSGFIAAHLRGELDLGYWFPVTRARRIVLLGRGIQICFAPRSDHFNLARPGPRWVGCVSHQSTFPGAILPVTPAHSIFAL